MTLFQQTFNSFTCLLVSDKARARFTDVTPPHAWNFAFTFAFKFAFAFALITLSLNELHV